MCLTECSAHNYIGLGIELLSVIVFLLCISMRLCFPKAFKKNVELRDELFFPLILVLCLLLYFSSLSFFGQCTNDNAAEDLLCAMNLPSALPFTGISCNTCSASQVRIGNAGVIENETSTVTRTFSPLTCRRGGLDNILVTRKVEVFERTILDSGGKATKKYYTNFTVIIYNSNEFSNITLEDVVVDEKIPSSIANSTREISIGEGQEFVSQNASQSGSEEVHFSSIDLSNSPIVIRRIFDSISPGESNNFTYTVQGDKYNSSKDFTDPSITALVKCDPSKQDCIQPIIQKNGYGWINFDFLLIAVGVMSILILLLYLRSQAPKEEGVEEVLERMRKKSEQ